MVKVDLNRPMKEILADLTKYPVATQLLTGTIVGPGHRPRQDQGTPGPGRGVAAVPEGPPRLLCRSR